MEGWLMSSISEEQFTKFADKVRRKECSRTHMLKLEKIAKQEIAKGSECAKDLLEAIYTTAVPKLEKEYAFIGFCPGADFNNRQDEFWVQEGICRFDFIESDRQRERFNRIGVGDTIILKKRLHIGRTMELFNYGEVLQKKDSETTGKRYLLVDWHETDKYLIVPALGSNSTVDSRKLPMVEKAMEGHAFWEWLTSGRRVPNKWNAHLV